MYSEAKSCLHCALQVILIIVHYILLLLSKADLRNRYEHFLTWMAHLHPVLMRQQLDYQAFAVDQVNDICVVLSSPSQVQIGKNKLSSAGPNVKVKSKLGPEIVFVMGWPNTTTTHHHHHNITFFEPGEF